METKMNWISEFRISSWKGEHYWLWVSYICENSGGILFWKREQEASEICPWRSCQWAVPGARTDWSWWSLFSMAGPPCRSLVSIKFGQVVIETGIQHDGQATKENVGIWNVNRVNTYFVTTMFFLFFSEVINIWGNGSLGRKDWKARYWYFYHSEGRFTEMRNIFAFVLSYS